MSIFVASFFVSNVETSSGLAIARELSARGGAVHCGVHNAEDAAQFSVPDFTTHVFDPENMDSVTKVANRVLRMDQKLGGLVIMPEKGLFGSVEEIDIFQVDRMLRRSVAMSSILLQLFLPVMRSNASGTLVLVRREFADLNKSMTGWMRACDQAIAEIVGTLSEEIQGSGVACHETKMRIDSECFDADNQIVEDTAGHSHYYQPHIQTKRRSMADQNDGVANCGSLASRVCDMLETGYQPAVADDRLPDGQGPRTQFITKWLSRVTP